MLAGAFWDKLSRGIDFKYKIVVQCDVPFVEIQKILKNEPAGCELLVLNLLNCSLLNLSVASLWVSLQA